MSLGDLHRWLYRGKRPNWIAKILNRAWAAVFSTGVASNFLVTLEVTGRKSGRPISLPVVMAVVDGERYLVSMLGDNVNWVQNVRAAGGKASIRSGGREEIQLEEVPAGQRAPILKAYLQRAPGAQPHVPVNKDAPLAEFQQIAAAFPVFRIASNKTVPSPASPERLSGRDDSDDDLSWLDPPENMHDSAAWDRYWNGHLSNGIGPGLYDMMAGDPETAKVMAEMGIKTVLCAGSGISQEPRALAEAGFEVTALDLSPVAMKLAQTWNFGPADLERFLAPEQRKTTGSAHFIVGDLLDLKLCPGPFDMIIERCTLQNFPEEERGRALDALIARLTKNGTFLSHCHDGGWRPDREPFHPIRALFAERGWTIWVWSPSPRPAGRSAWIYRTTG